MPAVILRYHAERCGATVHGIELMVKSQTHIRLMIGNQSSSHSWFKQFKTLIKGKPLVIDCWASWCIPCIEQMGMAKTFEKKYSDKIDFIFLSFDKEKIEWFNKVKQLNLYKKNCYLLSGNFKSVFAQYFDVGSIPRYIIIDKEGKVVTSNSIRPSHKVEFDKLLKSLIN